MRTRISEQASRLERAQLLALAEQKIQDEKFYRIVSEIESGKKLSKAQMFEAFSEFQNKRDSSYKQYLERLVDQQILKQDRQIADKDFELFRLVAVFGSVIFILGLGLWYYKIQRFQDREARNQTLS